MPLDDTQLRVIRKTWAQTVPVAEMAADLFYGRLFAIAPETKPLFRADMNAQGRKLIATLAFVVDHLDRPDALMPAAESLAIRHVSYGVTPDQYAPVGEALIWTLDHLLGAGFGDEERTAWLDAYQALSSAMIAAAAAAGVPAGDDHAGGTSA